MRLISTLLVSSLVFASCGGGGGGGGGGTGSQKTGVTSANSKALADAALDASSGVADSGSLVNDQGVLQLRSGSGGSHEWDFGRFVRDRMVETMPSAVRNATIEESRECGDGTMLFIHEDNDDDQDLSTGDTLRVTFENCTFEGEDGSISGAIELRDIVFNGDEEDDQFEESLVISFESFVVRFAGDSISMDGEIGSTIRKDGDEWTLICEFAGQFQAGEDKLNGGSRIELVENDATGEYSLDSDGSIEVAGIGTVQFETTTPFRGRGDGNPTEGVMIVSGEGNSKVTITALDADRVRIELDENGDGTAEETEDLSWDELDSAELEEEDGSSSDDGSSDDDSSDDDGESDDDEDDEFDEFE